MKKIVLTMFLAAFILASCGKKETKTIVDVDKVEQTSPSSELEEEVAAPSYKVVWTAFKTPKKVAVAGSFDHVELQYANPDAQVITDALKEATFAIDTKSVNSNDPGRDSKLSLYFFEKMVDDIHGAFHEFKDGKVNTTITMNGVSVNKELTYEVIGNTIIIKGAIDIIEDFKANDAFQSLHEICKDLHEGKSWSDVAFEVTIER